MSGSFDRIPEYLEALLRREHTYYEGLTLGDLASSWTRVMMDLEDVDRRLNCEQYADFDIEQRLIALDTERWRRLKQMEHMTSYRISCSEIMVHEELSQALNDMLIENEQVKQQLRDDLTARKRKLEQEGREPLNIDKYDVSASMEAGLGGGRESSMRRRKQPKRGTGAAAGAGGGAVNGNGSNGTAGGGTAAANGSSADGYYADSRSSGLDLLTTVGAVGSSSGGGGRGYSKKIRPKDLQPNSKLSEVEVMEDISAINTLLGRVANPLPKRAAATKRRS